MVFLLIACKAEKTVPNGFVMKSVSQAGKGQVFERGGGGQGELEGVSLTKAGLIGPFVLDLLEINSPVNEVLIAEQTRSWTAVGQTTALGVRTCRVDFSKSYLEKLCVTYA